MHVQVQVVPPGSTAKFPVVFQASQVQHYQQTVEYVVNGCHIFTFQVHEALAAHCPLTCMLYPCCSSCTASGAMGNVVCVCVRVCVCVCV